MEGVPARGPPSSMLQIPSGACVPTFHVEAEIGSQPGEPELLVPDHLVRHVAPSVAGEHHLHADVHACRSPLLERAEAAVLAVVAVDDALAERDAGTAGRSGSEI
jgi:hypothetical protein